MIVKPTLQQMTIRREGEKVLLILNGELIATLPWQGALTLARAIHVQAKRAEEEAKASEIADDQAVLIRAGFPLLLSERPDIFREAGNRAAWDRDLRRYLPGGIPSGVKFGRHRVIVEEESRE